MNTTLTDLLFDETFVASVLARLGKMIPVPVIALRTSEMTGLGFTECAGLIDMIILDNEDGLFDEE